MMTSLCHGRPTLAAASASALALQGVALALESVALLTSLQFAILSTNVHLWIGYMLSPVMTSQYATTVFYHLRTTFLVH